MSGCIGSDDTNDASGDANPDEDQKGTISFAVPPWPGATVKQEVVRTILEDKGYDVEVSKLDAGIIYAEMTEGNIDALIAGWLPVTHQEYWEQHGDELEKVKANVPSTWLGLAVPAYVYEEGVHSIEDLNDYTDQFDGRIAGIDPGAGVMLSTEEAIDTYGLDYDLEASSTLAMMAEVDRCIDDGTWVAFTIWEPHSAFAQFDIRKLEDPKQVYGGGDKVYTVVRPDLSEELPDVYAFFQNFQVSPDTQSEWILEYSTNDRPATEVAQEWVDNNQGKVEEWWPS
jgi:glycine betaine/proline transport system substrate-binding protein